MLSTAQVTAARLDDQINDVSSILGVVSAMVSVDPERSAENDALLRRLIYNIPSHVSNLTVWTRPGQNVGSSIPG